MLILCFFNLFGGWYLLVSWNEDQNLVINLSRLSESLTSLPFAVVLVATGEAFTVIPIDPVTRGKGGAHRRLKLLERLRNLLANVQNDSDKMNAGKDDLFRGDKCEMFWLNC